MPTQSWALYHMRVSTSADLAGAWRTFGGLSAQLNQPPVGLNIATTDAIAIALAYDRMVREFLAERARSRSETTIGESYFYDSLSAGNTALEIRSTDGDPRFDTKTKPGPKQKPKKEPKKGRKHNAAPPILKNAHRIANLVLALDRVDSLVPRHEGAPRNERRRNGGAQLL